VNAPPPTPLLLLLAAASACAGGGGAGHLGPRLGLNDPRVISAIGESPNGRAAALAHARAEVARLVSSRVESELVDLAGSRAGAGVEEEYQDFWQRVRVTARFEHAELIREASHRGPDQTGGLHEVVAVMSRAEADAALAADGASHRLTLSTHAARARQAAARGDREAFALAWAAVLPAAVALDALDVQRRVVLGRPVAEQQERHATVGELLAAAARLRERVTVIVIGGPGLEGDPLVGQLEQAVSAFGLRTRKSRDGRGCTPGADGADVIELRLTSAGVCRRGSLGHHCEARGTLAARACGDGHLLFELERTAPGIHPSRVERAQSKALDALWPALQPALREPLARHVPLR